MGRESWPHANGMMIIWPSSFNAVALRLSSNSFEADHGLHPWLSNATAPQLSCCFVSGKTQASEFNFHFTSLRVVLSISEQAARLVRQYVLFANYLLLDLTGFCVLGVCIAVN